jgi:hypothetical protein
MTTILKRGVIYEPDRVQNPLFAKTTSRDVNFFWMQKKMRVHILCRKNCVESWNPTNDNE